jgi:predicted membrane-bound spermidine synthase
VNGSGAPAPEAVVAPLGPGLRATLALVVLLGGGILMALEILAFRVIDKTFGSALRETSVVIAVFLTAMSLGYWLGGRWADRSPRARTPVLALVAAGLATLAVPALDDLLAPRVFVSSLPLAVHSAVVTTLLFAVPTLFLATLSPIAVRLLAASVRRSGSVAGGVAALSTVGSIAGSVATAFVLIDLFESVHRTIFALALSAFALAALLGSARLFDPAFSDGRPAAWLARHRLTVALALVAAAAVAIGAGLAAWSRPDEAGEPGNFRLGEIVFQRDSPFHHISVVDRSGTRSLYFRTSNAQSRMSLADPYEGGAEYTDFFHVPMALDHGLSSALMIGLGGGTVPKRWARDYPGLEVDAVEIDPVVVDVARRFFFFETGPRLRVASLDGRVYLKRSAATWDLIGVDAYTTNTYGSTLPAHLATREFFAVAAEHLSPDGFLVYNVAAPPHTPITRAIARTLREVFPGQMVFAARSGNTVFVAHRGEAHWKREEVVVGVREALASGRLKLASVADGAPRMLGAILPVGDAPVLTDDYAPVDTLMRQSYVSRAAAVPEKLPAGADR